MSNYYLCDTCEKKFAVEDPKAAVSPYCQCVPIPEVHHKFVIYDHHGFCGKNLDEPSEACTEYEQKKH